MIFLYIERRNQNIKRKTNSKYVIDYVKNNYKRYEIRLREEDNNKLQEVLNNYNIKIKDYLMLKIEQDLSKDKLRNLVREIAKQEKNEIIDKKGDYLISVESLKIKYEMMNGIFVINNLAEVKDLRDYLTMFDFAKKLDEIEIKNGKLNLLEFNIKETNLANLSGNYEIFRMEIGLRNSLIIVKR